VHHQLCQSFPVTLSTPQQAMVSLLRDLKRKLLATNIARTLRHRPISMCGAPLLRDQESVQDVGVVNIDPRKLVTTLQGRFGSKFQVHVGASSFTERLRSANAGGCR
jgi:hypothetical protein